MLVAVSRNYFFRAMSPPSARSAHSPALMRVHVGLGIIIYHASNRPLSCSSNCPPLFSDFLGKKMYNAC